jgi:hypothetical protein
LHQGDFESRHSPDDHHLGSRFEIAGDATAVIAFGLNQPASRSEAAVKDADRRETPRSGAKRP